MFLTGAEILIKSLIDEGVDTIFGYPGGAVLNIYDQLYNYREQINHILTAHEQGASHAADGYARSTGKIGVCLATSGPGATNLVTGIATAYMDSIPIVAITGNVTRPLLGKDSFQEVDIAGITMPITKHNYIVKDINDLQKVVKEAFYIAKEGRPGPVLIDIPKDITAAKAIYEPIIPKEVERKTKHITDEALQDVAKLINEAENPFIYAGGGIVASAAYEELKEIAEKINSPIATSLMAISSFPYDHPLYTGMIGMHGSKASNILTSKCDLLINLGARFSDRVINTQNQIKHAKVVHIDVDPAEINKNVKVDAFVVGDLKIVLQRLIPLLKEKKNDEWLTKMNELKALKVKDTSETGELTPEFLFRKLSELDDGSFVLATEVGQHQMWAAQNFEFKTPRSFISSGGLGTMGFGLGASIGVQMANKDKTVFNIAGDGSFGMNCNELATAAKNKLPVKVIIVNNNSLGMVRQWQNFFYEGRYSSTDLNGTTDFVKVAEAFGGKGFRVHEKQELVPVLKEALAYKEGPIVIDYVIHNDKKVFPMVAPGAAINEIISEEDV